MTEWSSRKVRVSRPQRLATDAALPGRVASHVWWHFRAAREIARSDPDVLISVEPHSALATWLYYNVFGGKARLFIHHHEYYAPEDFAGKGMRILRVTRRLERGDLFRRAEWISQTNKHRLRLLRESNPLVTNEKAHVFPNCPPEDWLARAARAPRRTIVNPVRFLYLGSASVNDTFIAEFAEWISAHRSEATLHVVGNNISSDVWRKLRALNASNISLDESGWAYDTVAERLSDFDVGVILYRGNTQNFIYNIPNKAIEYLAGGLEVWYPPQMLGMIDFHDEFPELRLRRVDFTDLPSAVPAIDLAGAPRTSFPFAAESALRPLIAAIAETP
jgi:hypothetical protein